MNLAELIVPLKLDKSDYSNNINAAKGEADNFGKSLANLAKGAISIAAITVALKAVYGALKSVVNASFEWANQLDEISDVTGVTSREAAAFNFVLRKSGVETGTFTKALTILEKGLVDAGGELDVTGEALKEWGIDVRDANGELKDQTTLIGEISQKYNALGTQQERVNFLTEIFGRSGADLIDFFDTLAKEGSLDEVTKKVEEFGLAIDPDRYEQFTRSLEELKLMGLGMAVQFTEQLMPALESFLTWIQDLKGLNPSQLLKKLSTDFLGFTEAFKKWAQETDWEQVSATLIEEIKKVDWSGLGAAIAEGVGNLAAGIAEIINRTDWEGLFDAIGVAFMDFMAGLTGQGDWENVKATWSANFQQLKQITVTSMEILKQEIGIVLERIKKDFFNYFQGAMQQAKKAIDGMKQILINTLTSVMEALRAVVAGGINIAITASMPGWLQKYLNVGSGGLGGSSSSASGKPGAYSPRASGGPVIAGQAYQVAEFFRPEVFTPSTNGRIDSRDNLDRPIVVRMDEERIVRLLRDAILMSRA